MAHRYQYSRWDGTQTGFELGADDVLAEVTDDLLYHGDLDAALRRMLQAGFGDRDGERVLGLRELLDRLRQRRREELEHYDLGSTYEDIAKEIRSVMDQERASLRELAEEARASDDERRRQITEEVVTERLHQLDMVPADLASQVSSLQSYEFTSSQARERFDQLLDRLRQQVIQSYFNQMAGAMQASTPEQLERTREMLDALNQLIEQRAAGSPDGGEKAFGDFMARFGDLFPGNPTTLDELLEQMARQMASMAALLNSMTPAQRAQLQDLASQLLGDLDLAWQVDRLAGNLQAAFPEAGWDQRYSFSGTDPLSLPEGASLMDRLGDLDQLENLLRSATSPGALADVDIEAASQLVGEDGARSLERLAELGHLLEEAGLVAQREGRLELTPAGLRKIGRNALSELFSKLAKDRLGGHPMEREGVGVERAHATKPYELGDPFDLNIERTLRNALQRTGGGTPVSLTPADFEVERSENLTRSSTVLMIDLSLSMPMRDNFLAAKKVAMALHALISSQFPRDYLGIVGFSEVARELKPQQLPEVSWDFVYGTNIHHALALSRRMLARQSGTKQIIMITDGEPTAHVMDDGEVFFNYPPVRQTVDATLTEVVRATREGIRINTFMLDATSYLREFVEQMTKLNRGRAFFTTPETLGDYILVDFIENKRGTARRGGGPR